MTSVRRVLVGLLVLAMAAGGCGDDESAAEDLSTAPWQLGGAVTGQVFGPFHAFAPRPIAGEPVEDGWQMVLLPDGNPVEAFNALVEEAQSVGFETRRVATSPCWRQWWFEENQLGDEAEGQTPLGKRPPSGSTVAFVRCHAVASHSDGDVEFVMSSAPGSAPVLPPMTAIVIKSSSVSAADGDAVQDPVPDLPAKANELPAREYLERIGLGDAGGAELAGAAVIDLFDDGTIDDGWCQAMLYNSTADPVKAVRQAVAGSLLGQRDLLTQTLVERTVVDLPGAAFGETVAADGGTLVMSAVASDTGTDLLICRASF